MEVLRTSKNSKIGKAAKNLENGDNCRSRKGKKKSLKLSSFRNGALQNTYKVFGINLSQKMCLCSLGLPTMMVLILRNTRWKAKANCTKKKRIREIEKVEENIGKGMDIWWPWEEEYHAIKPRWYLKFQMFLPW